ncbi:MAG: acetoacetate--CoA ligase [Gammaproteobacteria bacterium]|jgi:acetoacetyl-CoA synthetase|nr:acetoacetate--CoA ligase [Gammaproteobacteria bacterium]
MTADDGVIWRPTAAGRNSAALTRFAEKYAPASAAGDYAELQRWSLAEPAAFWASVAEFCGVKFSTPPVTVVECGEHMLDTVWFPGATLNYAEHLLRPDLPAAALVVLDERGRRREVSRAELRQMVLRAAGGLRSLGVQPGDRVAAVLPNCLEAVVALLAAATVGAVFSSCSPDFGSQAVIDRFAQIAPRVLIGCDGYVYAGRRHGCSESLAVIHAALPGDPALFVVPFLDAESAADMPPGGQPFAALFNAGPVTEFTPLPFAHPLCILFSSGTTGKPKCIVHGAGGTLLQHLKEHVLHTDLGAADRLLYFTTCGWMMWNWLVSALASGATVVLYDGSPAYPRPVDLWRRLGAERVTVFGTSPRFLAATATQHPRLGSELHLPQLRTVLSTGAPLPATSYDYVAEQLGPAVQVASISGGTDIISCFVLGNPWLPVYRGEIQCAGLGMAVAVLDDEGAALPAGNGELVCTQPFPSMPIRFWNDPDRARYRDAYFGRFKHCWCQGDIACWTPHGGLQILGRSDATLNPGGVRIGTAEVCGPALALAEICDALAVGHRADGDEQIVLFVVLDAGVQLDDTLRARIAARIRRDASPRHVPAHIFAVPEIPQTRSGKAVELAVRAVMHGADPGDLSGVANPAALQAFIGLI